MLAFDENRLRVSLLRLNKSKRTLFAAACSERVFPGYIAYSRITGKGNEEKLRTSLDFIWRALRTGLDFVKPQDVKHHTEIAESLLLDEEEYAVAEMAAAEDAAASIYYTLLSIKDEGTDSAIFSARRAYEAVDNYVAGLDVDTLFDEDAIKSDKYIQQELQMQQDDILALSMKEIDIFAFQVRARKNASTFLPWFNAFTGS